MSATIFQGDKVTAQKDAISLNGGPEFRTVSSDPQLVAVNCPQGSIIAYNGVLYRKTDNGSSTNVVLLGSGSGGGGINFIDNGDAELNNVTGWATYADAAGSRPVDGTGGTASVTFTNSATSPLADNRSFLFTKGSGDLRGQGVAYTFSVDTAYRAKVINIEFDYIVNSGTFVAGSSSTESDVIVYLYDVTNSALVEPSTIKLFSNSSTISDKFKASFQTSATGASYRLIFHVGSTSASAYELKIDNIKVSPNTYIGTLGGVCARATSIDMSNVANATVTYMAFGAPSIDNYGAVTGSTSNVTVSGTGWKFTAPIAGLYQVYSRVQVASATGFSGTSERLLLQAVTTTETVALGRYVPSTTDTGPQVSGSQIVRLKAGDTVQISFQQNSGGALPSDSGEVFIQQISSQSSDADTRVVVCDVSKSGTQAVASTAVTQVTGWTVNDDTHSGFSSNQYVVPVEGRYDVTAQLYTTSITANSEVTVYVYVNGADTGIRRSLKVNDTDNHVNVNRKVKLNAGDILTVRVSSTDSSYSVNPAGATFLSIAKISGPSAIGANELIWFNAARASTAQTVSSTSLTTVVFNTKTSETFLGDSHSGFNTSTGEYTVPAAGVYNISAGLRLGNLTSAEMYLVNILLNNTSVLCSQENADATITRAITVSRMGVRLKAGDVLVVQVKSSSDTSYEVRADDKTYFSLTRVGL